MITGMADLIIGIPDKVRGVAAETGFTQKRIALVLGISRTSVVDRFNGRVSFTAPEILKLARVMRVPVDRFFPSEDEHPIDITSIHSSPVDAPPPTAASTGDSSLSNRAA